MRLRSLADATREEYLRFVRKLAARHGGDPSALDEPAVRAHLLRLKDEHRYSPSSMRTAVAAMRVPLALPEIQPSTTLSQIDVTVVTPKWLSEMAGGMCGIGWGLLRSGCPHCERFTLVRVARLEPRTLGPPA